MKVAESTLGNSYFMTFWRLASLLNRKHDSFTLTVLMSWDSPKIPYHWASEGTKYTPPHPLCLLQSSSFSWFLKELGRKCGILHRLLVLQHGKVGDTDDGVIVPSLHPLWQSSIGFQMSSVHKNVQLLT